MSREFQSSVEQMIREAELHEVRDELKTATQFDFEHEFKQTVDPDGSLNQALAPPGTPDYLDPTLPGLDATSTAPAAETETLIAHGEEVPEPPIDLMVEPELPFAEGPLPHHLETPKA
jgi:sec-independent protein translocase protein TatB